MSAWFERVLNKLEYSLTKARQSKTPFQHWLLSRIPDSSLTPTETYSWQLYFRVATLPGVSTVLLIAFTQALVWVAVWRIVPQLFEPKYHKVLIGRLSDTGIYGMLPLSLLFLLLFNYALYLPRRFQKYRRAARLRLEPPLAAERVPVDPNVWPPPPEAP